MRIHMHMRIYMHMHTVVFGSATEPKNVVKSRKVVRLSGENIHVGPPTDAQKRLKRRFCGFWGGVV